MPETDWNISFMSKFEHISDFDHSEVCVLAISFTTFDIPEVYKLLPELKSALSEKTDRLIVVAGGPHPSGDPGTTFALGAHYIVKGEGEEALPAFMRMIDSELAESEVPGLVMGKNSHGKFVRNTNPRVNLDEFPGVSLKYGRWSAIEISRGCPWVCRFCQTPHLLGSKMRHRGLDRFLESARGLKHAGAKDLRFITPDCLAYGSYDGKSTNLEALQMLLEEGVRLYGKDHVFLGSFPSEVRPETATLEALSLLKDYVSNDNVIIGAQSGSNRMLKKLNRGHTIEDVFLAVHNTLDAGFIPNVDFIFGLPGETKEDINDTIDAMTILRDWGARVHSHTFMPLAGTPMYNDPPGKVQPTVRSMLGKLNREGLEFGTWQKQEQRAKEIADILNVLRNA